MRKKKKPKGPDILDRLVTAIYEYGQASRMKGGGDPESILARVNEIIGVLKRDREGY